MVDSCRDIFCTGCDIQGLATSEGAEQMLVSDNRVTEVKLREQYILKSVSKEECSTLKLSSCKRTVNG